MNKSAPPLLHRTNYKAGLKAPVRIVHLGLGAFHRARRAWYTNQVDAAHESGDSHEILTDYSFTGRSPEAANILSRQDEQRDRRNSDVPQHLNVLSVTGLKASDRGWLHDHRLGPPRPPDAEDGNWIQTMPGKGWFLLLRLYSPKEAFFTKEWRPSRDRVGEVIYL